MVGELNAKHPLWGDAEIYISGRSISQFLLDYPDVATIPSERPTKPNGVTIDLLLYVYARRNTGSRVNYVSDPLRWDYDSRAIIMEMDKDPLQNIEVWSF